MRPLCICSAVSGYWSRGTPKRWITPVVGTSRQWQAGSLYLYGALLAMQGHLQQGITQMRQGIDTWCALGAGLFLSHWLALLAEAYGQLGQTDAALQTVVEALAHVDNTGEGYYTAERSTACGANCSCRRAGTRPRQGILKRLWCRRICMPRRQKPVFSRPSPWPGANRRSRGSCGPP